MNFWEELPKPSFVVAPMADVTDAPFRRMIAKHSSYMRTDGSHGGHDVMWTEFVSADGLMLATPEGKTKLMEGLLYSEEERPIVAQLFSANVEHMRQASALCLELGFDGVDINMGCPDKSIEKQGCGAAMIRNPQNAKDIIRAAKQGCKSDKTDGIPVSVKTRIGYNKDELERWIPEILSENPAALTVHGRTRKEMSKVPADWGRIARSVEIRDQIGCNTLIIGNGDVLSLLDAKDKAFKSGADGVMVGRALFGNPWFFNPLKNIPELVTPSSLQGGSLNNIEIVTTSERLLALIEHVKLFENLLPLKNFSVMKKHFKAYATGFADSSHLRAELMKCNSSQEIELIVHEFLKTRTTK